MVVDIKRLLVIFLLCAGSGFAGDQVLYDRNVGPGGDGLGAPRHQLSASATAGEFYYYRPYYSTNRATMFIFGDYGESLVDSARYNDGGPTSGCSDHSHVIQRGDTIWITDNQYDSLGTPPDQVVDHQDIEIFRYSGLSNTIAALDSMTIDSAGFDQFIVSPVLYKGDSVMLIVRSSGSEQNLSVTYATGTWGDIVWRGDLYATNSVLTRIVAFTNGDSVITAFWVHSVTPNYGDLYCFVYYEGAWDTVGAAFDNTAYLCRDFSGIVGKDGVIYISAADTAETSSLFCWWLHPDSSVWVKETIHTSDKKEEDGLTNRGMRNILTYSEYDNALRCLFTSSTGQDNALDRILYSSKYNDVTHTWASPITISTDDSVKEVTCVEHVPAAHGSRTYLYYNNTTATSTAHHVVTFGDPDVQAESGAHATLRKGTYRGFHHAD